MHKLPDLPYDYSALEPVIDTETMHLHHDKHHAGYVEKLNKALESKPELLEKTIEDLLANIDEVPEDIRQSVINNGGGHANHSLFWEIMRSPQEDNKPEGEIAEVINSEFGDFEKFKQQFSEKALGVFGSGWIFLILDNNKKLKLKRHSFQNSPLMQKNTPILGLDVWEHAYYLKYQNKRAEYIENWWKVVNWTKVEELYKKASGA